MNEEQYKAALAEGSGDIHVTLERMNQGVTFATMKRPEKIGRSSLAKYKISVRHIFEGTWPAKDDRVIEDARRKYDAGTHEMCQAKDGEWYVLYCIPRKRYTARRHYFSSMTRSL